MISLIPTVWLISDLMATVEGYQIPDLFISDIVHGYMYIDMAGVL